MQRLANLPPYFKLFASLMLCVAGLCYVTLLGAIWHDTEWNIATIAEGYGMMDPIELTQHSFQHIFWFFGIFTATGFLFLLSSFAESLKRFFAVFVPLLVILDIGCQWLIRFHSSFAWLLFLCGAALAVSFLVMFSLIQFDLWIKKEARQEGV